MEGSITFELRVEGQPGQLDAAQSLRVLSMLAEVAVAVAPEGAELPLVDMRISSATALVEPTSVSAEHLIARVDDALQQPAQITRQLRSGLTDAFRTRSDFGIEGFGYRVSQRSVPFDQSVYRRMERSLSRPTDWASITGEVRSVGRSQSGLYGKIRDTVDHHVVNFEAPNDLDDALRESLFRRAVLSGETEMDDGGNVKRIVVERVEQLGPLVRLSELDLGDARLDSDATLRALEDLRRA